MKKYNKHIFICVNDRGSDNQRQSCAKCGGMDIRMKFVKLINKHGLKGTVRANKSGCLDVCELGPAIVIYPDEIWYTNVQLDDVDEIFQSNIINHKPVKRLVANDITWNKLQLLKELKN
ncbi:(2Fe-2S) ferredoxin domain-containing protein [bacterium]|nr:MAG: (2Fe-2S) ferredoxin domain-containing protein [bacterium]